MIRLEQTLKITSVLSDPTRFYIYQYITKRHKEVTVQEIADEFDIHPNVARLHLSKLEDVNMLVSETKKTGKGGRPSRLYRLSDDVIQLHFPFRDYQLLAKIAMESFVSLGEAGKEALYQTGKKFGQETIERELPKSLPPVMTLRIQERLNILKDASTMLGFYPEFVINEDQSKVHLQIFNCPFKELVNKNDGEVCEMHQEFIRGMFEVLFDQVELIQTDNMVYGCTDSCSYVAKVSGS